VVKRGLGLFLAALMVLALGLGAVGCSSDEPAGGDAKIVVGTEAAYPPFEMIAENGEITGFDAELMIAVGKAAGYDVEMRNMAWTGLIPALEAGEIDAVISAMTITDERAQVVAFSDPYFTAGQVIAVKEGSDITSPADLIGRKVGVQANTTGDYACQKIGMRDADIKRFPSTPDAFNELLVGACDAVVADLPVVAEFIKTNPDAGVVQVGSAFTVEYYGIAMRQMDTELHEAINLGLAKVKASGEYDAIYDKYFK
jgi:ABC-type amino acid transport substrate-binding protein